MSAFREAFRDSSISFNTVSETGLSDVGKDTMGSYRGCIMALSLLEGPLTSISGSINGLSGEVILFFCLAGLLVEGLKVPEEDPLCEASLLASLGGSVLPLECSAAF